MELEFHFYLFLLLKGFFRESLFLLYLIKQKSSLDYMFWKLGVVGKRASLPFYLQERI